MNDEQYRMAQLESSHADTRRLALEVLVDRLTEEVAQLRQALHIVGRRMTGPEEAVPKTPKTALAVRIPAELHEAGAPPMTSATSPARRYSA